jgi:sugar O-acyltransferase (sialic acid O-acetyltransferase NeuD family)
MSKPTILLIGAGGHALSCIDVIEQEGIYKIAGLIGLTSEMNIQLLRYSVIGTDKDLAQLANKHQYAFITVGQIKTPTHRIRLYQDAVKLGFQLPVLVSATAYISPHATIEAGTIVMHGAIVNAGARIGKNCIINSRALVEHDTTVEDHCHISTGTILNGNVRIGTGSFVGSGSVIKEGVSVGKICTIGMGLSVRHNLTDGTLCLG